jgi:hypothetical protein
MSWELSWRNPALGDAATVAMLAVLLINAEAAGWRRLLLPPLGAAAWLLLLAATGGT